MEKTQQANGAGRSPLPASRRLSLRAFQDAALLDAVHRACQQMGIRPRFFLRHALETALTPAGLVAASKASMSAEAAERRARLAARTTYRHKNLL